MAGGGDGYASLGNGRQLIDASGATLMATMVMDHVESLGTVAPAVDGRIRTPLNVRSRQAGTGGREGVRARGAQVAGDKGPAASRRHHRAPGGGRA